MNTPFAVADAFTTGVGAAEAMASMRTSSLEVGGAAPVFGCGAQLVAVVQSESVSPTHFIWLSPAWGEELP